MNDCLITTHHNYIPAHITCWVFSLQVTTHPYRTFFCYVIIYLSPSKHGPRLKSNWKHFNRQVVTMSQTVLMIWLLNKPLKANCRCNPRGGGLFWFFFYNARNNFVSVGYSYIRKLQVSGVFKHVLSPWELHGSLKHVRNEFIADQLTTDSNFTNTRREATQHDTSRLQKIKN